MPCRPHVGGLGAGGGLGQWRRLKLSALGGLQREGEMMQVPAGMMTSPPPAVSPTASRAQLMAAVSSVEPSHAAPHVVMLSDLPEHAAGQLASALATASNKAGRKMEALFTFIRSFQRSMQSKGDAPPESDEVTLVNALNPPPYSRRTAQHEQRRASCANRMHFR